MKSRRYLCIYFPTLSVNLVQRKLDTKSLGKGILLVSKNSNQIVVSRLCDFAVSRGVKNGTNLSLAKAFVPNAVVQDYNPDSDFESLHSLAVWAIQYTPLVGIDFELKKAHENKSLLNLDPLHFGITLDITGTDRVHKGEANLVHRIFQKLQQGKFNAKIAIGPSIGSAWAFSRFDPSKFYRFTDGDLSQSLAPLPLKALRLGDENISYLQGLGIRTIGGLLGLPRSELAHRFGKKVLFRIDQALNQTSESISYVHPPESWFVHQEFEFALLRHDTILLKIIELLGVLTKKLIDKDMKSKLFLLYLQGQYDNGDAFRIQKEFSLYSATQNKVHLDSMITPVVESLRGRLGPIYLLVISCRNIENRSYEQRSLSDQSEEDEDAGDELINCIVSRIGHSRVVKPIFDESYLPERSYQYRSVKDLPAKLPIMKVVNNRPTQFLQVPEKIDAIAMLPDNPPSRIYWKNHELRILYGEGPECISNEWWKKSSNDLSEREYYKVQDHTGRWLWIYRIRTTQMWFIHGMWA